jgi:hypothetical protein
MSTGLKTRPSAVGNFNGLTPVAPHPADAGRDPFPELAEAIAKVLARVAPERRPTEISVVAFDYPEQHTYRMITTHGVNFEWVDGQLKRLPRRLVTGRADIVLDPTPRVVIDAPPARRK